MTVENRVHYLEIAWNNTSLQLRGDKTIYWPARDCLLVADCHFGKAATFRGAGIPVPSGTTEQMLQTLTRALTETAARRLIVLGDLVHGPAKQGTWRATLAAWRQRHAALQLDLVPGNHDRGVAGFLRELNGRVLAEPHDEGGAILVHHPQRADAGNWSLAGHLHPAIRLVETGRSTFKLPCFYLRHHQLILPAFGDFTGTKTVTTSAGDQVFAIADGHVFRVGNDR